MTESNLFKLFWKHCYAVQGHGVRILAKTEDEAREICKAYCLETITKLW